MVTRIPFRDEWSPRPDGWDAERTFDVHRPVAVTEPEPRKCKRHKWEWTESAEAQSRVLGWFEQCRRCGMLREPA